MRHTTGQNTASFLTNSAASGRLPLAQAEGVNECAGRPPGRVGAGPPEGLGCGCSWLGKKLQWYPVTVVHSASILVDPTEP
jgi:hypothetical protein